MAPSTKAIVMRGSMIGNILIYFIIYDCGYQSDWDAAVLITASDEAENKPGQKTLIPSFCGMKIKNCKQPKNND